MSSEERTAAGAGRRYVEDTSTGGIRRAARPGLVSRVFWAVVIAVSASMAVISLYRLYTVRSQRPLGVTSHLDDGRSQDFPAVTICNVNPVTASGLSASTAAEAPAMAKLLSQLEIGDSLTTTEKKNLRVSYQTFADQLTLQQRLDIGHDLLSMLADCHLGDVPCDASNFTEFYHLKYGNCYTFVAHPSHQSIWKAGVCNGLTLDLVTNIHDYTAADEAGFVVAVHKPRDTPFLAEEGVFVPQGAAAFVAVTKNTREGLDNGCEDNGAADQNIYAAVTADGYSYRGCQHGCLQMELYGQCGCCDVDIPCPASFLDPSSDSANGTVAAPRCDAEMEVCRQEVIARYTAGTLPCLSDCVPLCSVTRYPTHFSTTTLLAQNDPPEILSTTAATATTSEATVITSTTGEANKMTVTSPATSPTTSTTVTVPMMTSAVTSMPPTTSQVTMTSPATSATSPTTFTIPTSPMSSGVTSIPTPTSQATVTETGSGDGGTTYMYYYEEFSGSEIPVLSARKESETIQQTDVSTAAPSEEFLAVKRRKRSEHSNPAVELEAYEKQDELQKARVSANSETLANTRLSEFSGDDFSSNTNGYVRVHVYFQDLRGHVTESVGSYDWVEWMADIGGVASLWLGLSVLGVLEVLHALAELVLLGFTRCCGSGNRPGPTTVKPFAPADTAA